MYVPKFAAVGVFALIAVAIAPFFIIRLLLFFLIVRLIIRLVVGNRFRHHHARYAYHAQCENRAEPLEQGDYRFFARRFEKEYASENKPMYSDKDLV